MKEEEKVPRCVVCGFRVDETFFTCAECGELSRGVLFNGPEKAAEDLAAYNILVRQHPAYLAARAVPR